ncbi:hypothetical protein C8R45DRAFT_842997 [Mycena sanguinolenta]|nr:hypothetical protein C8R45DRAFT_842997 [Mycena sanguinolenta]
MCGTGPPYVRWFLIALFLVVSSLVSGSTVNRTIDDVNGDSVTGDLVLYLPEVPASEGPLWFNQTSCSTCADIPDATFAFDNTWSAAQYSAGVGSMSLSVKFTGTAIYVFFILPNFSEASLVSTVLCDFFIDGVVVGSFSHQSDGSGAFVYNALVYRNTSIPDGDHVLLIETTGADPAVIIFDYAIYTFTAYIFSSSTVEFHSYPTVEMIHLIPLHPRPPLFPPPPPRPFKPCHKRVQLLQKPRALLPVSPRLLPKLKRCQCSRLLPRQRLPPPPALLDHSL